MSRSLLARSLEPLVAISWGVFLFWTVWMAAVWIVGINQQWLELPIGTPTPTQWEGGAAAMVEDRPAPPNADLRRAILLLAEHAEIGWLALALIQLHLCVISINGMNTARTWLAIAVLGSFLLATINYRYHLPFGWMYHSRILGAQFFSVPIGWLLLWAVLTIGARETILWLRPRASHLVVCTAAAGLMVATIANLNPIARDVRAWWFWHNGQIQQSIATPWWFWLAWFAVGWGLLFLMRERNVMAGAAARSNKPFIILLLLNGVALLTHARRLVSAD